MTSVIGETYTNLFVEFDPVLSWGEAVELGGYDEASIPSDFDPLMHLPSLCNNKGKVGIGLRQRKDPTEGEPTIGAWQEDLSKSKAMFIHPLLVLAIGASKKHKDEQRQGRITVVWCDCHGGLWRLDLYGDEVNRYMFLYRVTSDCKCRGNDRAAVTAKSQ